MNKLKHILFLIESLSGGGAEKVLTTLLQHLDSSRFQVTLCCIVNKGKYIETVKPYITRYCYLLPDSDNLSGWSLWRYRVKYKLIYNLLPSKWVYRLFIPKHADIEVAFVEGFATKLLAHSTNKQAKKIAWVHTNFRNFHWTTHLYKNSQEEERIYQRFNKIIAVSNTANDSFKQVFSNNKVPVYTLYNPIDNEEIIRLSAQPLPVHCLHSGKIRLASIGRLTPVKAYDRLLRILHKLKEEQYDFECWLLGDGEEKKKLEDDIQTYQMQDRVTLWGFQSNPYNFLAQCDLFICSSISEGYSTAVTEALIVGLPVITTACSGMHELLKDGECGVITENSEEALYQGLKELLDHPERMEQYRRKAMERGKEFSLEKLMKPIEDLLSR